MMANQQETTAQSWGTLEELLLACAVNRYGTKSWDSVAIEIQNRRSSALPWLTPQLCEDKFNDLTRRFMSENDADFSATDLVPMVDQLRRIRVEELRREVRERDDSIVSLELKLKRLEEERGRRSKEEADLGRDADLSPDFIAGKPAGEDDSGERDDRSFNESNSTSQKPEPTTEIVKNGRNDVVEADAGEETRERKVQVKTEPNRKEPEPVQPEDEPTVGRVDDDDDNKKQSSDVQSSASLSKKKRPRKKGAAGGATSSGDEPEREEVSPANKRSSSVKSEPLIRLLEMIRAHRLGSAFERRQRSQESERYKALIKQHIDLQTIQSRLEKGLYANYTQKFFRDLLLLFNNIMIFHQKKNSQEHNAAKELLALVRKEMATIPITKPAVEPATVKPEPEKPRPLLSKPTKTSTVVACGKRGSVKALTEIVGKKGDGKKEKEVEEKVVVSEKKVDGSVLGGEEKVVKKKRSKEIAVTTGQRSSKTGEVKQEFGGNEISSHDNTEVKMEKKEKEKDNVNVVKKKQGAASFLKRIKQNSPGEMPKTTTKKDENEGEDNDSEDESKEEKEEEEEKKGKGKGKKKEVAVKDVKVTRSSGGRGAREESGRGKRGGGRGRPPKRGAAAPAAESPVKRGRENGDNEAGSRARKRSRR